MKTIIVYYSLGGFTKSLAEKLAAESGADLLELRPVKAYPSTGARRFIIGGRAAVTGKKPPLQTYTFDADRYDRIIFGSPVWASSPAPPLRSFIAENSATVARKAYGAFFTQLGSGADKALKKLGTARARTAVVGDQIFTDVMGGNFAGMPTILVEPFHIEKGILFKIKRGAESLVFRRDFTKLH